MQALKVATFHVESLEQLQQKLQEQEPHDLEALTVLRFSRSLNLQKMQVWIIIYRLFAPFTFK